MDGPRLCRDGHRRWRRVTCGYCEVAFDICGSCWRGQKYCSKPCRQVRKKVQRRESQKKYSEATGFKEYRRDYQREYRRTIRIPVPKEFKPHIRDSVTEPTSNDLKLPVFELETGWICFFCRKVLVRDG